MSYAPFVLAGGPPFAPGLQEQLRVRSDFCDAVVLAGGRRFVAHRAVLAGSSPFFKGLFTSTCKDSHGEMTLEAVSASSFEAVLA